MTAQRDDARAVPRVAVRKLLEDDPQLRAPQSEVDHRLHPSCVWPATSPKTCATPGNAHPALAERPARPGFAGGFGTSLIRSAPPPARQNPQRQGPVGPKEA
jgi:hypothetical protein